MSLLQSITQLVRPSQGPIRLTHTLRSAADPAITLRQLTMRDQRKWSDLRQSNDAWLAPWQSGDPVSTQVLTYRGWMQRLRAGERSGTGIVFVIEYDCAVVGQISLGAISYGAMRTGVVGYWVDERHAGHGIAPMAVALMADWAMFDATGPRLHRLEIAILPENKRSRRVVEKLQAHHEGVRPSYMYINGRWRDHITYSLLAEDVEDGFTNRLIRRHATK